MLPVCSTAPAAYAHCQALHHVSSKQLSHFRKSIEEYGNGTGDRFFLPNRLHSSQVSCKANASKIVNVGITQSFEQSDSIDLGNPHLFRNGFDAIVHGLSDECIYNESQEGSYSVKVVDSLPPSKERLCYVGSSSLVNEDTLLRSELTTVSPVELSSQNPTTGQLEELSNFPNVIEPRTDMVVSEQLISDALTTSNASTIVISDKPTLSSDSFDGINNSLSQGKEDLLGLLSGIKDSVDNSINRTSDAFRDTLDAVSSSLTNVKKSITESFDTSISGLLPSGSKTGELADTRLTDITRDLRDNASKVGIFAVDTLRNGIVAVEDYLGKVSSFLVSSYQSTKLLLPPEILEAVNSSEQNAVKTLQPVKVALDQVSIALGELEKFLGFDPNDPTVPFFFIIGGFAILVISYRVIKYGGYAGDLSPASTLELLSADDSAILIDIRPEILRDKDGIPDIRRGARFRYTSITVPVVDGSIKKLLKSGRDVEDALLAAIIKNLKIVQDRSKVIILDKNGSHSKSVARSLRKLGLKEPYLVDGGFGSWVKEGLRTKENKAGTALTILTEGLFQYHPRDTEAILEEIKPTPLKILGFGLGLLASGYALLEWDKTLQIIGLVGLGQSIYRRVSSYENVEDLGQDLRTLMTPVSLGSQAISWAAGKLEPNNIGLPTSPSSTAVQSRVLQAAAKHESQPSDAENSQDSASTPTGETLDLSEA